MEAVKCLLAQQASVAGPAVGLCHGFIVVFDESQDAVLQILKRKNRRPYRDLRSTNLLRASALMTDVTNAVGEGNVRGSLVRRHVDYRAAQRPTSANGKITGPELTLMSATNARRAPAPVLPIGHVPVGSIASCRSRCSLKNHADAQVWQQESDKNDRFQDCHPTQVNEIELMSSETGPQWLMEFVAPLPAGQEPDEPQNQDSHFHPEAPNENLPSRF